MNGIKMKDEIALEWLDHTRNLFCTVHNLIQAKSEPRRRVPKPIDREGKPKYKVGDLVQAQYRAGKEWFYAMILSFKA